jgi:hypothetical protein
VDVNHSLGAFQARDEEQQGHSFSLEAHHHSAGQEIPRL